MQGVVTKNINGKVLGFFFGTHAKYLFEKHTGQGFDESCIKMIHNKTPYYYMIEILTHTHNAYILKKLKSNDTVTVDFIMDLAEEMNENKAAEVFVEIVKEGYVDELIKEAQAGKPQEVEG